VRRTAISTCLLALSCGPAKPSTVRIERVPVQQELPADAQGQSLLGHALVPTELPPEERREREAQLREARARYDAAPDDAEAIIWLGRRTAYMGDHLRAIEIYGEGIRKHPQDARMLRHRGHRYITLRRLPEAIADLERAAELVAGKPDEVEPDGQPNARGIPTSTLQFNVWYHLGLARYLAGDFAAAEAAYRACQAVSKNPDALVATTHWHYMTLRRLGRESDAAELLVPIHADLDVVENASYHLLTRMYKGELDDAEVEQLAFGSQAAVDRATLGYGLANWHAYNGRAERAADLLQRVLEEPQWAAFGYIAAEADVARQR
jgi:tetratricopeptide (TPR) repeat protein